VVLGRLLSELRLFGGFLPHQIQDSRSIESNRVPRKFALMCDFESGRMTMDNVIMFRAASR
jgi:hypothetical protein